MTAIDSNPIMKRKHFAQLEHVGPIIAIVMLKCVVLLTTCAPRALDYGSNTSLLTPETDWYSGPEWSPDGESIGFSDYQDNDYVIDMKTGIWSSMHIGLPQPVPNSSQMTWYEADSVAYIGWGRSTDSRWLVISDLDGIAEIQFETAALVKDFCWSIAAGIFVMGLGGTEGPQGDWIQEYDPELGRLQAYLGRLYQVEENEVITSIDCHPLRDEIAVAIRSDARPMRVERMSLGAAEREVLFEAESGVDLDELSFSPDGEWLAVRTVAGSSSRLRRGIMLLSTTGEDPIQLDLPWRREGVVDLAWSPTSNQLLVRLIHRVGHYSLHLLDVSPWLEE